MPDPEDVPPEMVVERFIAQMKERGMYPLSEDEEQDGEWGW